MDILDTIKYVTAHDKYQSELIKDLQNRIEELNLIIGNLDNLNNALENENKKLKNLIKFSICKYPPYMLSDMIKESMNIYIGSSKIVRIAEENKLFEYEFLALRIPRKRNTNEKFASTVIFSILGAAKILDIIKKSLNLFNKYNVNIENDLDISLKQLKEGKITKYSIKDLRAMENE
ncbi:hypothetical protein [uncultured Brachyspira sp.]|uniref:hypothetical protein n=1 Tax=uncultured Brachyspira sp. TaxID=221953 RepID=UPI0025D5766A|nr:hypothetical protein [uncultured Brachyspira sp.]